MNLDEAIQDIPRGWYKAFGQQMYGELKSALEKRGLLEDYRVDQVKEKFGELRWYDSGGTDETDKIIDKYIDISSRTCISCGDPATKVSDGWILPFCDACYSKCDNAISGGSQ